MSEVEVRNDGARPLKGLAKLAADEPHSVMVTIEQINDVHTRLGSARTLPEYVRALKALGVERYDSYLADGHSEYFGQGGHTVVSPPVHEVLPVAETGQRENSFSTCAATSGARRLT
jgi:Protein of unknown function (DUF1398)